MLARALDAGDDVVARHNFPAHFLGQRIPAVEEFFELFGRAGESLVEFLGDFLGDLVLDLVTLHLAYV